MSSKLTGYCIAFRDAQGMPGVYFMFGRESYNQILNNIKRAGETLIGVFIGDKKPSIKVNMEAGKLVRSNADSLEEKLRKLGFKMPRPN